MTRAWVTKGRDIASCHTVDLEVRSVAYAPIVGYREVSVRHRTSAILTRIYMAILCRIGCVRYVRLTFPIVGGEVAKPNPRTAMPRTIVITHVNMPHIAVIPLSHADVHKLDL